MLNSLNSIQKSSKLEEVSPAPYTAAGNVVDKFYLQIIFQQRCNIRISRLNYTLTPKIKIAYKTGF